MMFIDPTAEKDAMTGKLPDESPEVLDQCFPPRHLSGGIGVDPTFRPACFQGPRSRCPMLDALDHDSEMVEL
jgi:hypothetical protein